MCDPHADRLVKYCVVLASHQTIGDNGRKPNGLKSQDVYQTKLVMARALDFIGNNSISCYSPRFGQCVVYTFGFFSVSIRCCTWIVCVATLAQGYRREGFNQK